MWHDFENINGKKLVLDINEENENILECNIKILGENETKKVMLLQILLIATTIAYVNNYCGIFYTILPFIVIEFLCLNIIKTVKEEKLLIIPSLGCQITTIYYLGRSTRYIAWHNLQNVFINEVISKQRIIFLLSISTPDKLITLFEGILPRLDCLEIIYKKLHIIEKNK